jgi:hypothetical protein
LLFPPISCKIGDRFSLGLQAPVSAHVASPLGLSLNGCGLGPEGGRALAQALCATEVMVLELMNNQLGEDGGGGGGLNHHMKSWLYHVFRRMIYIYM